MAENKQAEESVSMQLRPPNEYMRGVDDGIEAAISCAEEYEIDWSVGTAENINRVLNALRSLKLP